ncbi:MAG: lysoplasmalogenase family protein [Clostridiales bacterium]|nr:lysoplasmalogenase family protein [Clostridiales bacterium]
MIDIIFFFYVLLCFFVSTRIIGLNDRDQHDADYLRAAMFLTVLADFCMLVWRENTVGLALFIAAQFVHSKRYAKDVKRLAGGGAEMFFLCVFAAILIFAHINKTPARETLAGLYACSLLTSVTLSYIHAAKIPPPNRIMIPLGMTLFLLCDINVGLYNLSSGNNIFRIMIWVFYLPSQALLALSAKDYHFSREA